MFDFSYFGETTQVNNLWFIILMIVFIITSLGGLIASVTTLGIFLRRKYLQFKDFVRLVHDLDDQTDDIVNYLGGVKVHYYDHNGVTFHKKGKK